MTAWSEGNVQANGITIHYYRTGGDKKPSILLLHGIIDSGQCWPRVAADLEGSYDVTMTDARGHGHSGTSADFSIALLADDAAAVILALGLEKPYVWGHSMGAITAATLAAAYPDLVRAVVLEDPPLMDKPLFQTAPDKELFQTGGEQQELNIDALEPALAAVANAAPWREVISRIERPILLVTGDPELHVIVTPEIAQEAAQLWKHGEVLHISGAGHNIHRDRYDETMTAVRAFFESYMTGNGLRESEVTEYLSPNVWIHTAVAFLRPHHRR
jgi:N-formylmaleamate deformylase